MNTATPGGPKMSEVEPKHNTMLLEALAGVIYNRRQGRGPVFDNRLAQIAKGQTKSV